MYKDGKWAQEIVLKQDREGKWGSFHSMSQPGNKPLTTEQALRRLEQLGYTIEDECIQKAVSYMNDCLTGKKELPDYREKGIDWDVFTDLILATWIRRFTFNNPAANKIAKQWAEAITVGFSSGTFNRDAYVTAYTDIFNVKKESRYFGFETFYFVSLLCDCFDERTEQLFVEHILNSEFGIYYIYPGRIVDLPNIFESKDSSYYLNTIELLSKYKYSRQKLRFVADWLNDNRNENGKWDMGKGVNDKVYFPLSDDWRKKEIREADCTARIEALLKELVRE